MHTIGRGLEEAPILRQGLGVTWLLAIVGAVGRVVVPVLLQQAIDRGIVGDEDVRVEYVGVLGLIAAAALVVSGIAQRQAVVRLGTRSEEALFQLRGRLIGHIHRLSLADHNEERRGALVAAGDQRHRDAGAVLPMGRDDVAAQRTADGPRRRGDAGLRLDSRPRRLRPRRSAGDRPAPRSAPLGGGLRSRSRTQRRDDGGDQRGRRRGRDDPRL